MKTSIFNEALIFGYLLIKQKVKMKQKAEKLNP
jgi:hypothetical protein